MPRTRIMRNCLFVASLAAFLQACASAPPDAYLLPSDSGIYAVQSDHLRKINGDTKFENASWNWRSTLASGTQFVVFRRGQNLAQDPADAIHLRRVAWVRSRITAQGAIMPISGSRWGVPTLKSFEVPVSYRSIAGHDDAILVIPQAPLQPGLYQIDAGGLGGALNARIGVNWPNLDHDSYAAANCVDRHESGTSSTLEPCSNQPQIQQTSLQQPAPSFKIALQQPVKQQVDGVETLLIQGTLTSTSNVPQQAPKLIAQLLNASGEVLAHWTFTPPADKVAPGQSVSFQTQVATPPKDVTTVHVDLASETAGQSGAS